MRKLILSILIFFVIPSLLFSQTLDKLKKDINNLLKNQNGTFAIVFKELKDSNNIICINENEIFNPGSTIKTCVMVQIYKDVFNNKLSLQQPIKILNSFTSVIDSSKYSMDLSKLSWDPISKLVDSTITLYELNKAMIINSSNIGMNNTLLLANRDSVNKLMQSIGLVNTKINRFGDDLKAEYQGINNTSTAFDMMLLYKKLYYKELVSPEICDSMLNVLKEQKVKRIIEN